MTFKIPCICNLKSISVDVTSLHYCLKNKQLKLNAFSGKDPAKGVFSSMHRYEGCGYYLYMTDHTPMQLEKYYRIVQY